MKKKYLIKKNIIFLNIDSKKKMKINNNRNMLTMYIKIEQCPTSSVSSTGRASSVLLERYRFNSCAGH